VLGVGVKTEGEVCELVVCVRRVKSRSVRSVKKAEERGKCITGVLNGWTLDLGVLASPAAAWIGLVV
jgi:hypothetical protein